MDNKVYVDSEQLTSVAASIKVKANNILNIFQGDCSSAIILGKECLQVSGLDTTAIINSLNKIFTNLSTRINTLSDFLTQKVAGEYDLTSQSIINAFNGNFATELAALLGLTVGTTVVPGVTGNGAGTAGSTGGTSSVVSRPFSGGSSSGCSTSSGANEEETIFKGDGTAYLTPEQKAKLEAAGYKIDGQSECGLFSGKCRYTITNENGEPIDSEKEINKALNVLGIKEQINNTTTSSSVNSNASKLTIESAMEKLGYTKKEGYWISSDGNKAIKEDAGAFEFQGSEMKAFERGDISILEENLEEAESNSTIAKTISAYDSAKTERSRIISNPSSTASERQIAAAKQQGTYNDMQQAKAIQKTMVDRTNDYESAKTQRNAVVANPSSTAQERQIAAAKQQAAYNKMQEAKAQNASLNRNATANGGR